MPRKLKDLYVRMIGLVDKGANQEAMIAIAKRATETSGDGAQRVQLKADYTCPECGKDMSSQEELDAHMAENHEDAQKALAIAQEELAAVKKELEALKVPGAPPRKYDEVKKELEATRQKMQAEIDQATKELETSRAEVVKITKQRRRERFITRAQELSDLPGATADDFGEILDHMEGNQLTAKEFEKVNQMLTSWNVIVQKSKIFDEVGSNGVVNFSGPEGQLIALAKEKMAADPKLTYAKAYSQAMTENPSIYRAYTKEREGK